MLLLVVVCLTVSNWLAYRDIRDIKVANINQQSSRLVLTEAAHIERWVAGKAAAIDALATQYQRQRLGDNYVETAHLVRDAADLTAVFLGFDDGRTYSTMTGSAWQNGVALAGRYDPRERDWYDQAQRAQGLDITDVYVDSTTGNNVVSIIKGVHDGTFWGDIELAILSETVKGVDFPGAITAILDDKGIALASNSPALTMGTRFTDIGLGNVQRKMLAQEHMSMEYSLNGEDKLAFSKAIPLVNGKQWYLFIGVNKSVAYASLDDALMEAVISSVMMLLIASGVILVVLNRLYQPITSLKTMILALSQGNADLTRRLPVTSDDDIGQMSLGINRFVEHLQQLMLEVLRSSEDMSQGVGRLKEQTHTASGILQEHTTETDQVVAAVEEMSATANDVAGNASDTAQFTQETNVQTTGSKAVVGDATTTVARLVEEVSQTAQRITDIGKGTTEITEVLNVIGEIAEQTNLLALNAAIEAARAGDQGRGFAVVADEVRALAARTQTSTAEIAQTLENLRDGADAAISAMDGTRQICEKTAQTTELVAKDLDGIGSSVTHINDLDAQIATAAEEQSAVADEITRNMSAIRDMVARLTQTGEITTSCVMWWGNLS